ncbi:MAG: PAS domain-containing protein [Spirochaetes bacterium]|nr:PAS domain-containing protein [Spirochaetota bacterium]
MNDNTILDSIADGVFTVDNNWRITSFNRAAETITGTAKKDAIGKTCYEVFRSDVCESGCVLKKTMTTGRPIINRSINILRSDGIKIPVSISTALLKDSKGAILGGAETFRDLSMEMELRKELNKKYRIGELISKNHFMQQVFNIIRQVARTNATVLIQGESGTGKELAARAIHNLSLRKEKPFIAVNCGALPENLLESELFGYKKGAFTDAVNDKPGRFDAAKGGTLFLDEIGDMPRPLQVKLLRVLQEKTYEPLGSIITKKADARIIAATNKNLEEEVKTGNFREDLFYRINIVPIRIPPLRERKEDIPLIIDNFIHHFNTIYKSKIRGISQKALSLLVQYNWPGNIRELENSIEYAFVLCDCPLIEKEHLPVKIRNFILNDAGTGNIPLSLEEIEKRAVIRALQRNNFKKLATARELHIDKNTLRRKIKKYNIPENKA